MTITVNGADSPLRPGGSVRDLLTSMGLPDKGIAVASTARWSRAADGTRSSMTVPRWRS